MWVTIQFFIVLIGPEVVKAKPSFLKSILKPHPSEQCSVGVGESEPRILGITGTFFWKLQINQMFTIKVIKAHCTDLPHFYDSTTRELS